MQRMIEEEAAPFVGLRRRRPVQQPRQEQQQQPSTSRDDLHRRSYTDNGGGDERYTEDDQPPPLNSSRLLSSSRRQQEPRSAASGTAAPAEEASVLPRDPASEAARTPMRHPARPGGPEPAAEESTPPVNPLSDRSNMGQQGARREEPPPPPRPEAEPPQVRPPRRERPPSPHRLARVYCLFSFGLALAAVITPSKTHSSSVMGKQNGPNSRSHQSKGASSSLSAGPLPTSNPTDISSSWLDFWPFSARDGPSNTVVGSAGVKNTQENSNWFLDVVSLFNQRQEPEPAPKETVTAAANPVWSSKFVKWLLSKLDGESAARVRKYSSWLVDELVDPILLERPLSPTTLTDLLDKILTSTVRLLALANLLLSWTYILQTAVADWFLDPNQPGRRGMTRTTASMEGDIGTDPADPAFPPNAPLHRPHQHHHQHHSQQQPHRLLGGFLVFKMLLVSAVVAPDTLDWMILLSWYTLLSFLRSLSRTCANVTERSGMLSGTQPPPSGAWQLLAVVLVCDILAAAMCVALFHGAGWAMVVLLTWDCALLGLEVVTNLLEYVVQWLETQHIHDIHGLERNVPHERRANDDWVPLNNEDGSIHLAPPPPSPPPSPSPFRLDPVSALRLEVLERQHARRLQVLETTIFAQQLVAQLLTCAHFVHIWSLHGIQFSLIDGVLALHLHSAITTAGKKIQERRNRRRIARGLDGMFATATPSELRRAAVAGDVCCICLCSMTINVKKVACGHLYHTGCLREVVERARSIEAARCPLCRSSLLNGRRNQHSPSPPYVPDLRVDGQPFVAQGPTAPPVDPQQPLRVAGGNGERPLFRFSSEEVFPDWLPLPAFAFEVVRRPSANTAAPEPPLRRAMDPQPQIAGAHAANEQRRNAEQGGERPSLLRQLMILAGAIVPLSPEEEAGALDQLVDMFPQYDRTDLLRALRQVGSPERVAESILSGHFAGLPRGRLGEVDAGDA